MPIWTRTIAWFFCGLYMIPSARASKLKQLCTVYRHDIENGHVYKTVQEWNLSTLNCWERVMSVNLFFLIMSVRYENMLVSAPEGLIYLFTGVTIKLLKISLLVISCNFTKPSQFPECPLTPILYSGVWYCHSCSNWASLVLCMSCQYRWNFLVFT